MARKHGAGRSKEPFTPASCSIAVPGPTFGTSLFQDGLMSPRMTHRPSRLAVLALLAGVAVASTGCSRADAARLGAAADAAGAGGRGAAAARLGSAADAAVKVYVPPGSYDEFYAFMSGGFDGQVGVYGLPSGRLLKHVPVFSQNPENGWGYSAQ